MLETDLRPSRYQLTLTYAEQLITEYYEQNPISQLAIVGMADGIAVSISQMSGNPHDHIMALRAMHKKEPKGDASLQNALDMAQAFLL